MGKRRKLGSTGKYPQGKMSRDDEGEIRLAVTHDSSGHIKLVFGTPLTWLGFGPVEARALAGLLVQHAEKVEASSL